MKKMLSPLGLLLTVIVGGLFIAIQAVRRFDAMDAQVTTEVDSRQLNGTWTLDSVYVGDVRVRLLVSGHRVVEYDRTTNARPTHVVTTNCPVDCESDGL